MLHIIIRSILEKQGRSPFLRGHTETEKMAMFIIAPEKESQKKKKKSGLSRLLSHFQLTFSSRMFHAKEFISAYIYIHTTLPTCGMRGKVFLFFLVNFLGRKYQWWGVVP